MSPFLAEHRAVRTRRMMGLAVAVLGIILGLAALFGPWWSLSLSGDVAGLPLTAYVDYGLFGASIHALFISISVGYDALPEVGATFLICAILMIAGMAVAAVSLRIGYRGQPRLRRASLGTAVGAAGLLALAPFYLLAVLPGVHGLNNLPSGFGATSGDFTAFWGSGTIIYQGSTFQLGWGAGWAWYAAFLASAFVLAGCLTVALSRPRVAPISFSARPPSAEPQVAAAPPTLGTPAVPPVSHEPPSPASPPKEGDQPAGGPPSA